MEDIAGKKEALTVDRGEVLNKNEDRENPFVTSLVCNAESVNAQLLALITGDSRLYRKKNVQKEDKTKPNQEEVDSTKQTDTLGEEVTSTVPVKQNLPVRDLTMPQPKERDEVWNPEETTRDNSEMDQTKEQPVAEDANMMNNWDSDMGYLTSQHDDDVRAEDNTSNPNTEQATNVRKYKEVNKDMSKRSQMV